MAGPDSSDLGWLWNRVLSARDVVDDERRRPIASNTWVARADLLVALEAYAAALVAHNRPIPYALRDELRLRRQARPGA